MALKIIWFMLFSFGLIGFAGIYGIFYTLGRLKNLPRAISISYIFGILQLSCAIFLVGLEVVDLFWRLLILITSIFYLFLPPLWFLFIKKFH